MIKTHLSILKPTSLRRRLTRTFATAGFALAAAIAAAQTDFGPGPGGDIPAAHNSDHSLAYGNFLSDISIDAPNIEVVQVNSVTITGLNFDDASGYLDISLFHRNADDSDFRQVILTPGAFVGDAGLDGTYSFVVDPALLILPDASNLAGAGNFVAPGSYATADTDEFAVPRRDDFSRLAGVQLGGIWTLAITNADLNAAGSLTSWRFNATIAPVPEPGTIGAMAAGSLWILRRRRRTSRA